MALLPAARRVVAGIDPDRPLANVVTMEQQLAAVVPRRGYLVLAMVAFALMAMLLASIGIYGVISYSVAQRTREIGIRVALGAGAAEVVRLVGGRALLLIAVGLSAGLGGALALTRLLQSQLWGVTPTDPATFAGAIVLLVLVALAACALPLRRATGVDPTSVDSTGADTGDGATGDSTGGGDDGPNVDVSDPQLYEFELDPLELDPTVVDNIALQYAQLDTRVPPIGKLVFFLSGYTNTPASWRNHGRQLAGHGFHVVLPHYDNDWSCEGGGGSCNEDTRWEALTVEDTSTVIATSRADSAEGRVITMLHHLMDIHPGGDWGYYLDEDDNLRGEDVIIAGIAHGAASTGFSGKPAGRSAEDYAEALIQLFERCRQVVGK